MELTLLFRRWYGPIPPIKKVRGQVGEWATPGQTRTVALTGGGTMREELTRADPPSSFAYRLTDLTGAVGPLVDHIDGAWTFTPVGTGTRVSWCWTLYPRSARTRPGVVLLGKLKSRRDRCDFSVQQDSTRNNSMSWCRCAIRGLAGGRKVVVDPGLSDCTGRLQ